jgi:hypothetical protein
MSAALPDIGEALAPVIARVPREQQPLLIALAERMAAVRYRDWAAQIGDAAGRAQLLACADREERIAAQVEALYRAPQPQRELLAKHRGRGINRSLFAGRPLASSSIRRRASASAPRPGAPSRGTRPTPAAARRCSPAPSSRKPAPSCSKRSLMLQSPPTPARSRLSRW